MPVAEKTAMVDVAKTLLLALLFSLAFMQPAIHLLGLNAVPGDFVFLGLAAAFAVGLALGHTRIRWHRAYFFLALYFAALALSALVSADPVRSAVKLLTQIYLLGLPILVFSLIEDRADLRRAALAWLAGTSIVALIAMVSLAAFCIDPASPLLAVTQNEFGTLPALPFPRLRLTFLNANQLCNYLTVSLMLLLVAWRSGWIGRRAFLTLLAGIVVAALFTLSPGLGAFWLAVGLWLWLVLRSQRRGWAHIALTGGIALALLSLPVMLVTPIIHPTAPFVFKLPLLDVTVAPSVRLMIWMDAVPNFLAEPILGRGIGMEAVRTRFIIPAGELRVLTDAHNAFLHVAVQCGLVGLAAFLLLLLWIAGRTLPLRFAADNANVARLGFGLAFLNGMAIHGVSGSFEDSRHLWVVLGLFLAADRLEGVDGRFGNTVARQP